MKVKKYTNTKRAVKMGLWQRNQKGVDNIGKEIFFPGYLIASYLGLKLQTSMFNCAQKWIGSCFGKRQLPLFPGP